MLVDRTSPSHKGVSRSRSLDKSFRDFMNGMVSPRVRSRTTKSWHSVSDDSQANRADETNIFASSTMVSQESVVDRLKKAKHDTKIVKLEIEDLLSGDYHSLLPVVKGLLTSDSRPWQWIKFVDAIDVSDFTWWQGIKNMVLEEYRATYTNVEEPDTEVPLSDLAKFQANISVEKGKTLRSLIKTLMAMQSDAGKGLIMELVFNSPSLTGCSTDQIPKKLESLFRSSTSKASEAAESACPSTLQETITIRFVQAGRKPSSSSSKSSNKNSRSRVEDTPTTILLNSCIDNLLMLEGDKSAKNQSRGQGASRKSPQKFSNSLTDCTGSSGRRRLSPKDKPKDQSLDSPGIARLSPSSSNKLESGSSRFSCSSRQQEQGRSVRLSRSLRASEERKKAGSGRRSDSSINDHSVRMGRSSPCLDHSGLDHSGYMDRSYESPASTRSLRGTRTALMDDSRSLRDTRTALTDDSSGGTMTTPRRRRVSERLSSGSSGGRRLRRTESMTKAIPRRKRASALPRRVKSLDSDDSKWRYMPQLVDAVRRTSPSSSGDSGEGKEGKE